MSAGGDYLRQMPESAGPLQQAPASAARLHIDLPLLALLLLLTGIGLLVLYSAAGQDTAAVQRQARYFLVAYAVMFAAAQFHPVRWFRWSPWVFLCGVSLLLAVTLFGVGAKGAQRWLQLGGFRFQPSEIMKLAVPMTVAWYLDRKSVV